MDPNPAPQPDKAEEPVTEEQEAPDLKKFLEALDGAPTEEQVRGWKVSFGDTFCSGFTDTELYIWRPVSRDEWLVLQNEAIAARQAGTQIPDSEVEIRVVEACILWTSDDGRAALRNKAGTVSTLNEQIMLNSNFLPTAMAASMVIKL